MERFIAWIDVKLLQDCNTCYRDNLKMPSKNVATCLRTVQVWIWNFHGSKNRPESPTQAKTTEGIQLNQVLNLLRNWEGEKFLETHTYCMPLSWQSMVTYIDNTGVDRIARNFGGFIRATRKMFLLMNVLENRSLEELWKVETETDGWTRHSSR